MKQHKNKLIVIVLILAVILPFNTPLDAQAASSKEKSSREKPKCDINVSKINCKVVTYYEKSEVAKISISATGSKEKAVKIVIREEDDGKTVYKSKSIKVKNGKWKLNISKKIPEGKYEILISGKSAQLTIGEIEEDEADEVQTVAAAPATTFSVNSIPLLAGGIARGGTSVPISYLQITNTGNATATLKGFWVKQNGNAPVGTVIGLSTVDDKGGSRGLNGGIEAATVFTNGQAGLAFAPTDAIFAPKQMRLFTIKAMIAGNISTAIGTQLMLDVSSLQADANIVGQFPIRGTTWTLWY
jgi:hypothetical protein